jgi:hypothetical protein
MNSSFTNSSLPAGEKCSFLWLAPSVEPILSGLSLLLAVFCARSCFHYGFRAAGRTPPVGFCFPQWEGSVALAEYLIFCNAIVGIAISECEWHKAIGLVLLVLFSVWLSILSAPDRLQSRGVSASA